MMYIFRPQHVDHLNLSLWLDQRKDAIHGMCGRGMCVEKDCCRMGHLVDHSFARGREMGHTWKSKKSSE